jgi:FAD/FMN-containing dehydrogenase
MSVVSKTFKTEENLIKHLKSHAPSFYFSSRTSTVVPYDKLDELFSGEQQVALCDLSELPSDYKLLENGNLLIRGPLSWLDARIFLKSKGRNIKTAPTEDLALVTAGAATSCTGERCFGYGNLRSQISKIKYWDFNGIEQELINVDLEGSHLKGLKEYQREFNKYSSFKNAPFPRIEKEIDLMIGTEGQLGVISEIEIETVELFAVTYFFILLPRWEVNLDGHLEIYKKIQLLRKEVISVELIDSNAFSYLAKEDRLGQDQDVIFLEVKSSEFDNVYTNFLSVLKFVNDDQMFEISEEKFHEVRASIPRAVFEANSKAGVLKIGTDVQVDIFCFEELLTFYRDAAKIGIKYNLFGHFGDAHLHFNFMPMPDQVSQANDQLKLLYEKVVEWKGSPFAEHGIGIIKQKYIKDFLSPAVQQGFRELKTKHDPHTQFFPKGFMSVDYFLKK